jgi:DNA repair ATPase RecN
MLDQKIKNLNEKYNTFNGEVNRLIGQRNTLFSQVESAKILKDELESTQKLDEKSIEVLALVQKSTRDKIKEAFQNLVTFALKSIYQEDYKFALEFSQRGNIGELNFKLKDPKSNEYRDLLECHAGGSLDIISLALRFVLLQTIRPKVEGFVVADEPTKQLSRNYRQNEYNFYKHISEKLGRQLIIITHADEIIQLAENKIEIK